MSESLINDSADFIFQMKRYNEFKEVAKYIPKDNGLYCSGVYIPKEMLIMVMSYIDNKSLMKTCVGVCSKWNEIVKEVWMLKAQKKHQKAFSTFKTVNRLPWPIYRSMVLKNGYDRNLLKNNSGQLDFDHWQILNNGGDHWIIEKPPIGVMHAVDNIPGLSTSAFVTSHTMDLKCQIIDLVKEGINPKILDEYVPNIIVSERYGARWDCNSIYRLKVDLLDSSCKILDSFEFPAALSDWQKGWQEAKHIFDSYPPGVRYVLFEHGGKDMQFWAGHYGSKICEGTVIVSLLNLRERTDEEIEEESTSSSSEDEDYEEEEEEEEEIDIDDDIFFSN